MVWARLSIDVNDRAEVLGYSLEAHGPDGIDETIAWPCGPFDSPFEELDKLLKEAHRRYGEQMVLDLF
jgi:hypothetical protein